MVTSIMKKRTIRERKKNRRQTIAVWITTCIATALFAAVFSFASSVLDDLSRRRNSPNQKRPIGIAEF